LCRSAVPGTSELAFFVFTDRAARTLLLLIK
jgi:hypothetical protein